jgi:hypothetical protein
VIIFRATDVVDISSRQSHTPVVPLDVDAIYSFFSFLFFKTATSDCTIARFELCDR